MDNYIVNLDFTGRVVAITGGAGFIGYQSAKAFASLNASVALIDITENTDAKAKELSDSYGIKAKGYTCNLSEDETIWTLGERIYNDFGSLNSLILNAAFVGTSSLTGWAVPFEKQSIDTFRQAVDLNLTSPVFLIQNALPYLLKSKNPNIVNLGSIYGFLGPDMHLYDGTSMGNPIAYAASKGGLIQVTRWLSTVLAPDIRVNCISPGGVYRNQDKNFYERYVKKVPLGRMASEDDIANAIVFLASDLSLYITGQHLAVDGGMSAW